MINVDGCSERICKLKLDFTSHRLLEYVCEEQNQVSVMLSFGDTADTDVAEAFEIWRIYTAAQFRQNGIRKQLFDFA